MRSQQAIDQDANLVRRCLAGEQQAWRDLYHAHHDRLVTIIARQLRRPKRDPSQAEEVAAQLWISLLHNNGQRLLAYDACRGSLGAFLATLARRLAPRYLRQQARYTKQRAPWPASDLAGSEAPLSLQGLWWEEFWATLTEQERHFVHDCLTAFPSRDVPLAMPASQRKLKQRVVAKLRYPWR